METSEHYHHRLFLNKEIAAAPRYNNGERTTSEYYGSDSSANFDSNMVIVLAALLCALICALGLNSIVRCAIRCTYRFSATTDPPASVQFQYPEGQAVNKNNSLSLIPEVNYESGLKIQVTDCLICLTEFSQGEKLRLLPKCNHAFHVKCIDKWLSSHSSCPLCRQHLLDPSSATGEEQQVHIRVRLPENLTGR